MHAYDEALAEIEGKGLIHSYYNTERDRVEWTNYHGTIAVIERNPETERYSVVFTKEVSMSGGEGGCQNDDCPCHTPEWGELADAIADAAEAPTEAPAEAPAEQPSE